ATKQRRRWRICDRFMNRMSAAWRAICASPCRNGFAVRKRKTIGREDHGTGLFKPNLWLNERGPRTSTSKELRVCRKSSLLRLRALNRPPLQRETLRVTALEHAIGSSSDLLTSSFP